MPKLKTNKAAAKRFRRTKNGGFKRSKAYARHILTKKSPKRKRNLGQPEMLTSVDTPRVKRMLPYG